MTIRLLGSYLHRIIATPATPVTSPLLLKNPISRGQILSRPNLNTSVGIVGFRNYAEDAGSAEKEKEEEKRDPRIRDPSQEVSVETSVRYMKSAGYRETYGNNRIWVLYRRNFKGQFQPKRTRECCYRLGKLSTGNPCPICRDEYLVLDYRNVDLLKQFISPFNGSILGTDKTGLCREKHFKLLAEIERARDYGTLTFDIRFREFDYAEFYPKHLLDQLHPEKLVT